MSVTISLFVVTQDWRQIHFRSVGWLTLWALIGTPVGVLILTNVADRGLKSVLSVVIIAFSTYSLLTRKKQALSDDRFAWLFGFVSGVLGGTYGMGGPPVAIYGTLRGWSPQHFRATLQGFFLPASIMVIIGYWLTGTWTPTVTRYYAMALPVIFVGTFFGRAVNKRIRGESFLLYVYGGLIIIGLVLLWQSLN